MVCIYDFLNYNSGERLEDYKNFSLIDGIYTKPYIFASRFVKNNVVLDCGCGVGYGSYFLSHKAKKVVGIDISSRAIEKAKNTYKRKNLNFYVMDVCNLNFEKNTFDIVVAFQLIEHLRDPLRFIEEIKRVLKPGGVFILATPNKRVTSLGDSSLGDSRPICPFHEKEFDALELRNLFLHNGFRELEIFGQKTVNKKYRKEEEKYRKTVRIRIIRILSQIEIVRKISRIIPLKIKNFFTRPPNIHFRPSDLKISKRFINDAYILIVKAKK